MSNSLVNVPGMGKYTPLAPDEKDYFFGEGNGAILSAGKTAFGGPKVNRLTTINDLVSETQQQVDWEEAETGSVSYIKHKPTIPAAQIQSDWAVTNLDALDCILNKPTGLGNGIKAGTGIKFENIDGWVVINLDGGGS